ncbi:MAG TPA: hypothetical protein VGQ93_10825 [Lysobacter sp.]|jgi:hypothetical protein|nr:hypothetical protein [Lysobacter sp.]
MTENSYAVPAATVGDAVRTVPSSQHRRPLWVGLVLSALVPVLLPVVPLLVSSVFNPGWLFIAVVVAIKGLVVSVSSTVVFALPLVLLLRRLGRLNGFWVCTGAVLIGAVAMSYVLFSLSYYPQLSDNSAAFQKGINGLIVGAGFGLVSGLALSWGSGIPFVVRKKGQRKRQQSQNGSRLSPG